MMVNEAFTCSMGGRTYSEDREARFECKEAECIWERRRGRQWVVMHDKRIGGRG